MSSNYCIGDYLDVNGIVTKITNIIEGTYYHDDVPLTVHGNIVLDNDVLRSCGFTYCEGEWLYGKQGEFSISCWKEPKGTYKARITQYKNSGQLHERDDIIVLPVLQEFIRESCNAELPIDEVELTKAVTK